MGILHRVVWLFLPAATKLGQGNVFTGVCDSVNRGGVCLSACWWDTTTTTTHPRIRPPPLEQISPLEQTPPPEQTPPGLDRPEQTPPDQTPPREADSRIQSPSGRYTYYWNAFLLKIQAVCMLWDIPFCVYHCLW